MWVSHPSCKDIILETWKSKVIGCPMFILQKKLQILKSKLKEWNHSTFGNVHDTVKDTEDNLKNIQDQIAVNGNSDSLNTLEREAQAKLNSVLQMEEVFWKEKARLEGEWDILTDREKIANHVVSYYKDLFNKSSVLQEDNSIEEFIPSLMSDDTNNVLTMFPSYEKVHNVVLSLNIKDDVVKCTSAVFYRGMDYAKLQYKSPCFDSQSVHDNEKKPKVNVRIQEEWTSSSITDATFSREIKVFEHC
ncbi:unnamed protein product [Vicia faba]|uniref:Uncharacterized protein n=1 Tax=Vicia faba TaxID=3906 RepID=A0AAV0YMB9_VICFA|nr:unnamed protein product [Vicia faba]